MSKYGISNTITSEENIEEGGEQESLKMREILIEHILNNENELTVEGCTKILCNFQLRGLPVEIFKRVWK